MELSYIVLIWKPKACSICVSVDRAQRCPKEMTEFDVADEVTISGLFDDSDVVEEIETSPSRGYTEVPELKVPTDKQEEQQPTFRRSERLKSAAKTTRM